MTTEILSREEILKGIENGERCADCGDTVSANQMTLGEQIKTDNKNQVLLLKDHGFKDEDKLCDTCFWR